MSTREMAHSMIDEFSETQLIQVLSMLQNIRNLIDDAEDDYFYSESNMKHLDEVIHKIENGTSKLTEHDLIEVDDE